MGLAVRSSVDALAQLLRADIHNGTLAPGQFIRQEEVSARFGVSRSPLREALRQLEAEGLIDYHANRGAVVASMDKHTVRHVYQLRRILEAGAIELVVQQVSNAAVAEFRRLDAAMRAAQEAQPFIAAHHEFHQQIYAAAGNPLIVKAIHDHSIKVSSIPNLARTVVPVRACSRTDHARLLHALSSRDARAARAATLSHLDHLEAIVLETLTLAARGAPKSGRRARRAGASAPPDR